MARFAFLSCVLEVHVCQTGCRARRFMATVALHECMRTVEWKSCLEVIETRQVVPCPRRMTHAAADRDALVFQSLHHRIEMPMVRVGVTTRAPQISPLILRRWLRVDIERLLVATVAGNSQVAATKGKRCLVMSAQTKCGGHKPLQAVALVAKIKIWCREKLACMHVRMAIVATLKFHFVDRRPALRNVTLFARHGGMFSL